MKRLNKKKGFFRENYRESLKYIKDSRRFIYSVIAVFLFFTLIGFFVPVPSILETKILEFIEELLRKTEGLSQRELIWFILWNNLQSGFTGMLFGVVLGIYSVIGALVNGYVLGFVSSKVVGGNSLFTLLRLFPHGIFELPALFISLGLGLKLGTFIFKKNKIESLKNYLINSIKVFFFVVIPLLVIAAIIEGSLISLVG